MTPPVLTTRRLTLRPVTLDDADALVGGLSNWNVMQWLTAPPFPFAKTDAEHFITEIIPTTTTWAIDAGDGLIGVIGVKPDLGYWLDAEFHGQHVMSEAAMAVVTWYFETYDTALASGHFPENEASRTILRRLGFVDTHIESQTQRSTSDEIMVQRMALTPADWAARDA